MILCSNCTRFYHQEKLGKGHTNDLSALLLRPVWEPYSYLKINSYTNLSVHLEKLFDIENTNIHNNPEFLSVGKAGQWSYIVMNSQAFLFKALPEN